ncbi:MAG: protoporphyrinogen oxidase [Bryobacteraceae bacterium]|nr:protoporphyrinogen oxidase [Bryobacteraceae bacterium]
MPSVAIVGGGISGLATAYYLSRRGIGCTLIERRPRLGGVITTEVVDGCVIEGGPDSFLAAKPWAMRLIQDLGLAGEVIGSNDHLRVTYLWKGGRLVPLPDGLMLMVPTRIMPMITTRVVGWPTKIRMGLEYFRGRRAGHDADRSVAEFVEDHYGLEAVDYLAEPLLAGVYGGSPHRLAVGSVLNRFVDLEREYGSLTRGVLAERRKAAAPAAGAPLFQTLRDGLGRLVEAVERAIAPSTEVVHAETGAIVRDGDGFRVRFGGQWTLFSHVVLACRAYEAGELVRSVEPELGALLRSIPYSSSMTVALGYERSTFRHPLNGFGFLVPRRERGRMIACTWMGTKFENRVSPDRVVLRCFLGGSEDPRILDEPDESVVEIVRAELRTIMGVGEEPVFTRISRWPQSMAQYTVGHQKRLAEIEERAKAVPGIHLTGNAYYGIGIPDCVRMGKEVAERIAGSRPVTGTRASAR